MRPDYGDMLKRGIGYTQKTAKKRGSFPGWALTKIQCDQSAKNQRQRCAAMVHHPPLTEEVMQRMTVKAASSETPIARFLAAISKKW